jgi:hypothetical protein
LWWYFLMTLNYFMLISFDTFSLLSFFVILLNALLSSFLSHFLLLNSKKLPSNSIFNPLVALYVDSYSSTTIFLFVTLSCWIHSIELSTNETSHFPNHHIHYIWIQWMFYDNELQLSAITTETKMIFWSYKMKCKFIDKLFNI